ncbi:N-acetylmuramoyl-L-alanine amidase [Phototrophicus methaneseepsis]|uniref:N-acetylmuramoyl-L-alanine amidase n=1 Tax=Phototrophicus methaneseepsis TaxID=2710758 RepID=A0A7S8EC32_9CHLR|nr:peptidoglycan recognition family protein [Phototrophicus methaneseepsis]QPC84232.1 N-acetylmuramoyl-L-alanine amidase [Phototrophicus methaneseepsis]
MASHQFTRRDALLAIGLLGIGTGFIGALGISGLFWRKRDGAPREMPPTPTAAPDEQATLASAPPMVTRAQWGALAPDHNARAENGFYGPGNPGGWRVYDAPLAEVYTTLVVHHSSYIFIDDRRTLLDIQRLHREDRRWADVAYHYFVGRDGVLYEGRDIHVRGAHVEGANTGSVGVCFLGNYVHDELPAAQIQGTFVLMRWLADTLQLTHIATHRAFNDFTECPGEQLTAYIPQFAAITGLAIGTEGYVPPSES